jgi:hypothetical protein
VAVNTQVRWWHLLAIATGVSIAVWVLLPPGLPDPPDYTGQNFASVHVELRGSHDRFSPEDIAALRKVQGNLRVVPRFSASSGDPAVVAALADLLRTARPVVRCRCAALGTLAFRRLDGTEEEVRVMPAHDDGSVDLEVGRGRFRIDRPAFLGAAAPLGVPMSRWYRSPNADPPAGEPADGIPGKQ